MDLAALYDAWASRLLAYMMTITRDRHRAEDALQNLFVKLATNPPDLRDPKAYLYLAARREAWRASKTRGDSALIDLNVLAPSSPDSPDVDSLASALDDLPEEQVEVVLLHAIEGFTFLEVAKIVRCSPDTAASRYRLALGKLKERLRRD
ncbi:MAG TPA: RNA polymerase sigma factor [Planctomycetota bacterium]|nr:RNA polymerase sigma factor [Planctomycetota bacterium]